MFRKMRRWKQEFPIEESYEILKQGSYGTLALQGDEGYPYAVPMAYVFDGKKIYFHSAASGHKIDAINRDSKASFCVVWENTNIPEKLTTAYRSVVVFGRVEIVEDSEEKLRAIEAIGRKYSPGYEAEMNSHINRDFKVLRVISLTPEHVTGKEAIELMRMRSDNN
ncbi:MAG: pyridoxamine 5'-phosphate oxidase family protein [Clostridia bacterium]|nr:pyridoxamine 5'-phosphate oxidase family protein [Clostridia bacterium]